MRKLVWLSFLLAPAAGAERYAYVINQGDNTVSAIDVDTARVVATIQVGDGPRGIAVQPTDGRTVYVTSWGQSSVIANDQLFAIDVPSHTVRAAVTLPFNYPWGVAVDPAGDYLYVTHTYSPFISKIPTLTLDEAQIVAIDAPGSGNAYVTVDTAGDRLYYVTTDPTLGGGDLHWSDLDGLNPGGRTGVAAFPGGIAPFMDHLVLLTRQNSDASRSLISVDTKSATGLVLSLTSTDEPTGVSTHVVFTSPVIDVTRRAGDRVEQVFSFDSWSTGDQPIAVAFSDDEDDTRDREALITADFGASSATIAYADGTVAHVAVGPQPIAVAAGPVLRPRFQWTPYRMAYTYLNFDDVRLLRLKLVNAGAGSLRFESFAIAGADAKAFTVRKNGCPTTLAAGASCAVDVQFVALRKDGKAPSYSASLVVGSNDPAGKASIALTAKYGK
jgi:YVTN family beta-propeller protein